MLKCVSDYRADKLNFKAGETLENISAALEAHLLTDAPGCFEVVVPDVTNRAVKAAEVVTKPLKGKK